MYINIWDKVNREWITIKDGVFIVQLDRDTFKVDNVTYDKRRYEINFIHARCNNE